MAKIKSVFVCNECGYESAKWLGKCPACNAWNSFFEEKVSKDSKSVNGVEKKKSATPTQLNKVIGSEQARMSTGFKELDMVLGGGIVIGSLVLLGGEPGIGKSTLILQICEKLKTEGTILYISGEESAEQIKLID